MTKGRVEAFSDGVIAIIITIIVLMIDIPSTGDAKALHEIILLVGCYALSFVLIGMRWANHHHLFQVTRRIDSRVLWANLFYLFSLSLFPAVTGWIGRTSFSPIPTIAFAIVNLFETVAFMILERTIVATHKNDSVQEALENSKKEKITILLEILAVIISFIPQIRVLTYILLLIMSTMWIIPDLRLNQIYYQENESEADSNEL